ncbi:MAG TPA: hypothetical protein ENN36_04735 [Candidatus Bathyarchaeota archaeon]|nr:hypothetical protein [Candidatus Bathyarchaeota archaeon]
MSTEEANSYVQNLENLEMAHKISALVVSCRDCKETIGDLSIICIVRHILEMVRNRTKISWFRLISRIRYWQLDQDFAKLINTIEQSETIEDLYTALASGHQIVNSQINRLVAKEKQEYVLFVVNSFEFIEQQKQPVLAGVLHRLVKGSPAYFRIVSLGEPLLFRKDSLGEVGIQLNNDYIEIRK